MNPMIALLKEAGIVNILSDRITMEFVLEKLSTGFSKITPVSGQNMKLVTDTSALLVSTELSVFLSASPFTILALTDLWDSKEGIYGYGTRGRGEYNVNNPCLSMLGGSAQDFLVRAIPTEAVAGGFTRRVNFVFFSKKTRRIAWPSPNSSLAHADLVSDLQQMAQLRGEFKFTLGARAVFERYYNSCEPNEFDDEASAVYKVSKWANASKLAMAISASRGEDLLITEQDFTEAMARTEQVAADIGIVFRATGESPLAQATEKILEFIELRGYASRKEVLAINWKHVTAEDLDRVIATLREGGIIAETYVGRQTMYSLTPKGATKP